MFNAVDCFVPRNDEYLTNLRLTDFTTHYAASITSPSTEFPLFSSSTISAGEA